MLRRGGNPCPGGPFVRCNWTGNGMLATAPIILFVVVLGVLVAMTHVRGFSHRGRASAGRAFHLGRWRAAARGRARACAGQPGRRARRRADPRRQRKHGRHAAGARREACGVASRHPDRSAGPRLEFAAIGRHYASPACQAELVAKALEQLDVRRAILVGHSWGGAFATAYALAFPEPTAGLVLLSAVTHPWPADPGWYNNLASLRGIGPLFLRTLVYPLGIVPDRRRLAQCVRAPGGACGLRAPGGHPAGAPAEDVLRQRARPCAARNFIAAQVPSYADLRAPTIIITGDCDTMVSPKINACALAATLPRAKLVFLKGVGHMPHHAAPEAVAAAIDELAPAQSASAGLPTARLEIRRSSPSLRLDAGGRDHLAPFLVVVAE